MKYLVTYEEINNNIRMLNHVVLLNLAEVRRFIATNEAYNYVFEVDRYSDFRCFEIEKQLVYTDIYDEDEFWKSVEGLQNEGLKSDIAKVDKILQIAKDIKNSEIRDRIVSTINTAKRITNDESV